MEDQFSVPRREDFVVGEWRVEPGRNRIFHRAAGVERKLEPRLMHLLCFLAANPGRTLGRDDLIAELWPQVIVTENSLTRAISALRKALIVEGDDGDCIVKIETVPKRGYRLSEQRPAAGPARAGAGAWLRTLLRSRDLAWASLTVTMLAAALIAVDFSADPGNLPATPHPYAVGPADFGRELVPVSSGALAPARRDAPVVSADGGRYAFISHDAAGSTLWLGDLRSGGKAVAVYSSPLPLTNLVWSPAGQALLFARQGAAITAGAVYGGAAGAAQLLQFDFDTWAVSTLTPTPETAEPPPQAEIDLT